MSYTRRLTEDHRVDQAHAPLSKTAGTVTSTWYPMRDYHRATVLASIGAMAAGGTIAVSIRQAKTSAGGSAKAITGKTSAVVPDTGGGTMVAIELQTEELDVDNAFNHIAVDIVTGVAAVVSGALLVRSSPRFYPVPTTGYSEIVG